MSWYQSYQSSPLIDVRSPVEFAKGHVPKAINIPLLDDEERHQVGLCYRQNGQDAAVLLGLELVGPKMHLLAAEGTKLSKQKKLWVMCHRGGKRSQSMAWLWKQCGIDAEVIPKGYQYFRQSVLETFRHSYKLQVLGGATGVGKTMVLQQLKELGAQVIDLEGLAHHKGSAFGGIGQRIQPSNAQFENELAMELAQMNPNETIWVENESRMVGQNILPEDFWKQMCRAPCVYLERERNERIALLCADYQNATGAELRQALLVIGKRLGHRKLTEALHCLENEDRGGVVDVVLEYYDHFYFKSQYQNDRIVHTEDITGQSISEIAQKMLHHSKVSI